MVVALAHEMRDAGINFQQHLHVTAVDVDVKCVQMAYLQFSLLHIPAVVVHGNTLSMEEHGAWLTLAHIMGGWWYRLKGRRDTPQEIQRVEAPKPVGADPEPDTPDAPPRPREQLSLF